ncbi:MAG: HEPN domain-containing protein [Defluviitaleaceae bacterium]|nr:HEPN domain-containing protein [Defluviitaleaceae bacterium]
MENEIVRGHMKKACSNLKGAQVLFENEVYDSSVSSSYYAVFHGVSALLAVKGFEFKKHKTVISKYNEVYIHAGLIGSASFRALTSLFSRRMEGEYEATTFIGKEGASAALQQAKLAVQDIMEYCKANNILWEECSR